MIAILWSEWWRPVVEILILSVGIYYAFTFIRGTRGAPVVTGFLVLMITSNIVTNLLDLKVLQWMVEKAGPFVIFAARSEEHTSELQSLAYLVCRLLLE